MAANGTPRWNVEIWRKILNSVAGKYDSCVRFTVKDGTLVYEGDRECALEIVKEAVALIGMDKSAPPDPEKK